MTVYNYAVCWGANERGQSSPPEDIQFDQVSTSRASACGIQRENKKLICWGARDWMMSYPRDITFDEITLSWDHACGIKAVDGSVVCWGQPDGDRLNIPVEVS